MGAPFLVPFDALGVIYFAVLLVLMGLAIYALVLVIIFLRLRIQELRVARRLGPDEES